MTVVKKPKVTVVGSINMDLIVKTGKVPNQGETVLGDSFSTLPGGKGANQAVAAARLGSYVSMIGSVGNDEFGKILINILKEEGINTKGISISEEEATGIATIIISENDNRIIVAPGANRGVTPSVVASHKELILESDVVLLQLEIPLDTVVYTTELCNENNIPVIINPAPYQALPSKVINLATYLTPNDIEAEAITMDTMLHTIQEKLIITKGADGVVFYQGNEEATVPGFIVEVEDTTGAGDTFNGAFATKIGSGASLDDAILFANAAAALSVTKFGAQAGMPTEQQVNDFLKERDLAK
ncbi:ribokinase [Ornithinibacillus bavariensis]|uniref:ribokinase n=1 Tax=Ornithinibacillus bavariensis TaxID=545502 RepID=UPI003D24F07F